MSCFVMPERVRTVLRALLPCLALALFGALAGACCCKPTGPKPTPKPGEPFSIDLSTCPCLSWKDSQLCNSCSAAAEVELLGVCTIPRPPPKPPIVVRCKRPLTVPGKACVDPVAAAGPDMVISQGRVTSCPDR